MEDSPTKENTEMTSGNSEVTSLNEESSISSESVEKTEEKTLKYPATQFLQTVSVIIS